MHNIAPPNLTVRYAALFFFAIGLAVSPQGFAVSALSVDGSPVKSAAVAHAWSFAPTISGAGGSTLQYWIQSRPDLASFNASTEYFIAMPKAEDAGTDSEIIVNVSDDDGGVPLPASATNVSADAHAPTISGTPAKSVVAGQAYAFKPTAAVAAGRTLSFAIANKPAWAAFSTSSGALRGTPATASVGTYSNIDISASDGISRARLPAFAISVTQIGTKAATLSWAAPTANTNDSALTNLAGYRIYYGTSRAALTNSITVNSVGITTYVISNLSSGTYYFAVMAYNRSGTESNLSNIVSRTV